MISEKFPFSFWDKDSILVLIQIISAGSGRVIPLEKNQEWTEQNRRNLWTI